MTMPPKHMPTILTTWFPNRTQLALALLMGGSAFGLAGCMADVPAPEDVAPTPVSDSAYASESCAQLAHTALTTGDALAKETAKQRQAYNLSIWGPGSLSDSYSMAELSGNDVREALARTKGEMDAINRVLASKHCPGS
ncbi:hypothetical protein E3E12_01215 [Formicincola oecophyllae]|uniref:Uncharacterized protein n=1 Tax=Formicincola oecophyllae TaxID=2558361 RepID=A0A4Y6U7Q6_9PROT|nr:hypothetical protein [Formicincola oecophyllae]QDH13040.1 hypothetical protein E3E12_01215 [Formicincola oecophyllae]